MATAARKTKAQLQEDTFNEYKLIEFKLMTDLEEIISKAKSIQMRRRVLFWLNNKYVDDAIIQDEDGNQSQLY